MADTRKQPDPAPPPNRAEQPVTHAELDDLIALTLRLRGKHPDDLKSLRLLDRLQPNSQWRQQLLAKEADRLHGLAVKVASNRATADEIADHKEASAAHREAVASLATADKGGA